MEKTKLNKVSIRLINDAPLVSDEQLDTPKKAAKIVGDFIRDMVEKYFVLLILIQNCNR